MSPLTPLKFSADIEYFLSNIANVREVLQFNINIINKKNKT